MKLSNLFKTTTLLGVLGGVLAHAPVYAMDTTAAAGAGEDDTITRGVRAVNIGGASKKDDKATAADLPSKLAAFGLKEKEAFSSSLSPEVVREFLGKFDGIDHEPRCTLPGGRVVKVKFRPMLGGKQDEADLVTALGEPNRSQIPLILAGQVQAIPQVVRGTLSPLKWLFSLSAKEGGDFVPAGFVYAKVTKPDIVGSIPFNTGRFTRSSADATILQMMIYASPNSLYAGHQAALKPVIEGFFSDATGRCGFRRP